MPLNLQRKIGMLLMTLCSCLVSVRAEDCADGLKSVRELQQSVVDPSLPYSGRGAQSVHEFQEVGYQAWSPHDLSILEDGVYIFLIDEFGIIYFSPRVPYLNAEVEGKFLATHRGLLEFIKNSSPFGEHIQIFGGGEFQILNGKPRAINNKTGTFRIGNDNDHLLFSISTFKDNGLDFSRAEKTDINKMIQANPSADPIKGLGAGHMKEEEEARLRLLHHQDPKLKELRELLVQSLRKTYDLFPTPRGLVSEDFEGQLTTLSFSLGLDAKLPPLLGLQEWTLGTEEYRAAAKSYLWALYQFLNYYQTESPEFILSRFKESTLFKRRFGEDLEKGIRTLSADLVSMAEWMKASH